MEKYPQILEDFRKKHPNMNTENLYLCESVDMNGDVIDTKIGVNLLTNYGLNNSFVSGVSQNKYIWLGSSGDEPDPASSQLTSYISALARYSYTAYGTYLPTRYDSETKLFSSDMKVCQCAWDYTAGNNGEYEIWELGIGESQTTLLTHALIYDEEGVQTCIVKRPNTRLYITAYWTGSISVETIPKLYKEGKAILVDPDIALPWGGYIDYYFYTSARNMQYVDGDNRPDALEGYYWSTSNNTSLITDDPREAVYRAIDKYGDKTWEARELYASGIVGGDSSWQNRYRDDLHIYSKIFAHQYSFLDEPEELETYLCYVNNNPVDVFSVDSYSGNEHTNLNLFSFDTCFGYSRGERRSYGNSNDWHYPRGELSCSQFDISGLNMYNYITKEYDVDIPHHNVPDTIYDNIWYRANLELYVNYKGTSKYVYVFCNYGRPMDENGVPLWHITGFNNSNIVIAATDEYWDVDTYVEIPNLNAIPLELQRKRYYIVVGGTLAIIYPIIDYNRDNILHRITPTKQPYELTDDENGVLPRIISNRSYDDVYRSDDATYADSYIFSKGFGSKPIVDNDRGYFLISYMLAFCNDNDEWTNYKLLVNGKYTGCPTRRWKTETGDKIVMFGSRVCSEWNGTGFTNVTRTYANNANNFSVFTISDMNTEPTREDITLTWNDPSVVSTTESHHLYSWTNQGYLVVAKRRTESEFIWVNVYGENGCELHTVENAKHARAIENTSYVVYQDMNLSEDTTYVFNIFDMSTETIVGVITISDGAAYTINGLCGYNDHVYISTTLNDVDSTIYYNIQTGAMESLTFSISYAKSNHLWYAYDTLVVDNKWVVAYVYNENMYVYNGNIRESFFDTSSVHEYTRQYKTWLCCNTINEGKQLIFVAHGCVHYQWSSASNFRNCEDVMIDMGAYLDGVDNNVYHKHYPRGYNLRSSADNYANPTSPDVRFPFKDGIIWIRTNAYKAATAGVGRIYWFPPEMCLPMHIKGTTKQLTSFNNPIKFSISAPFTYHITNDLSRLLPNNGG